MGQALGFEPLVVFGRLADLIDRAAVKAAAAGKHCIVEKPMDIRLDRIDEMIVFHPLDKEQVKAIVDLQMVEIKERLADFGARIELTEEARKALEEDIERFTRHAKEEESRFRKIRRGLRGRRVVGRGLLRHSR